MKILVVHASAGAGHRKAAEAVYNGLRSTTAHNVTLADVLDYTSPSYRDSYRASYVFLVTKMSWAWGLFFTVTDLPWLRPLIRVIRRALNSINAKPFEQLLIKEKYDAIISTHFFSGEVAAALKRKGRISSKIICVVTDFDAHSIWLAKGIDCYTGACDFTRDKLIQLGVEKDKIFVTGIPTDKKFAAAVNKGELQKKLGLKGGIFTILIATGSFGMGPIKEIVTELKGYQVMVVCGNNKALYAQLSPIQSDLVKIHGLVNNMDELMSVSDLMITKPGGLSIAEALVKGLPLIFFSPIPGQETNNIKVLNSYGIGISDENILKIAAEVKRLSTSNENLNIAKKNIQLLARPSAAPDIIKLI